MSTGFNALTDALTTVVQTLDGSYSAVEQKTSMVLGGLAVIDIVLWGCWTMLGGESLANFAKKFVSITFWLLIIRGFHGIAKWLMHLLVNAATAAGGTAAGDGVATLLDPSSIAGLGLDATLPIADKIDKISKLDVGTKILLGLVFLALMAAFIVMAVNIAMAVIEYYMYLTLGGLLIPFAILAQTRFLADKGINAVLAATLKLTAYAFVIAIIQPILGNLELHKDFGAKDGLNWNDIFAMFLLVGFCVGLCLKAPQLAAGLIHGSPSLSGTGLILGAAGAALLGATKVAAAVGSGLGAAVGWGGRMLDGLGERIPQAGNSSMAAATQAGTMAGSSGGGGGGSAPPIFVGFFSVDNNRLGAPAHEALPANVIDSPAGELPSGERRLGPGDAG